MHKSVVNGTYLHTYVYIYTPVHMYVVYPVKKVNSFTCCALCYAALNFLI